MTLSLFEFNETAKKNWEGIKERKREKTFTITS